MAERSIDGIRDRLNQCLENTARLNDRLQSLLTAPTIEAGELSRLEADLSGLGAERTRLLAALRAAGQRDGGAASRTTHGGRPLREIALDVVDGLGVPSAPRMVSEFGQARYGVHIPSARIASLRRDEFKAFTTDPGSRPAYLAPGLLADSLTAVPRLVTSSAWSLDRRIIGSRSLRVNHLRTLIVVCDATDTMADRDEGALTRLMWMGTGLAGSIPGALDRGGDFDPARARDAASAELSLMEDDDDAERRAAAERASSRAFQHQVWGGPAIVPGQRGRKQAEA